MQKYNTAAYLRLSKEELNINNIKYISIVSNNEIEIVKVNGGDKNV